MFDPRISLANSHDDRVTDPCRNSNDSNDSCVPLNLDAKAGKTAQNWQSDQTLQFRPHHHHMEDESGSSSPPLWKTSPPRSLVHLRHQRGHYRSLSPTSRTQAIARGQRELMEMVKNMPEASYELSLKDLVEYPRQDEEEEEEEEKREEETQEECLIQEKNLEEQVAQQTIVKVKRQISSSNNNSSNNNNHNNNNKAKMVRNGSIDNRGLFLKMVFPVTLRSKKKKKKKKSSLAAAATAPPPGAKVSPKPPAEASEKSSKGVDKDWWKRRFSTSNESDQSSGVTTSSNSGSSGSSGSRGSSSSSQKSIRNRNRRKRGLLTNCCSCFQSRKDK